MRCGVVYFLLPLICCAEVVNRRVVKVVDVKKKDGSVQRHIFTGDQNPDLAKMFPKTRLTGYNMQAALVPANAPLGVSAGLNLGTYGVTPHMAYAKEGVPPAVAAQLRGANMGGIGGGVTGVIPITGGGTANGQIIPNHVEPHYINGIPTGQQPHAGNRDLSKYDNYMAYPEMKGFKPFEEETPSVDDENYMSQDEPQSTGGVSDVLPDAGGGDEEIRGEPEPPDSSSSSSSSSSLESMSSKRGPPADEGEPDISAVLRRIQRQREEEAKRPYEFMADPEAEDAKPEKRENDPFYLRPVFIVCTIFVIILIIISVVLVREFAGRRRRRGRH